MWTAPEPAREALGRRRRQPAGGGTCQQRLGEKGVEEEVRGSGTPRPMVLSVPVLYSAELFFQAANALPLLLDQRPQCPELLHHLLQLPSLLQGQWGGIGGQVSWSCSPPQIYQAGA